MQCLLSHSGSMIRNMAFNRCCICGVKAPWRKHRMPREVRLLTCPDCMDDIEEAEEDLDLEEFESDRTVYSLPDREEPIEPLDPDDPDQDDEDDDDIEDEIVPVHLLSGDIKGWGAFFLKDSITPRSFSGTPSRSVARNQITANPIYSERYIDLMPSRSRTRDAMCIRSKRFSTTNESFFSPPGCTLFLNKPIRGRFQTLVQSAQSCPP